MVRPSALRIGVVGVALLASPGAHGDDFAISLSPEQRPWAEACRRRALETFPVDGFQFRVLSVAKDTWDHMEVWLEVGPSVAPRRHRVSCVFSGSVDAMPTMVGVNLTSRQPI